MELCRDFCRKVGGESAKFCDGQKCRITSKVADIHMESEQESGKVEMLKNSRTTYRVESLIAKAEVKNILGVLVQKFLNFCQARQRYRAVGKTCVRRKGLYSRWMQKGLAAV